MNVIHGILGALLMLSILVHVALIRVLIVAIGRIMNLEIAVEQKLPTAPTQAKSQ